MSKNEPPQGKYELELNFVDESLFLNFWDFMHGNDVVCEIINDRLYMNEWDQERNPVNVREVTFIDFLELVKKSIQTHE